LKLIDNFWSRGECFVIVGISWTLGKVSGKAA